MSPDDFMAVITSHVNGDRKAQALHYVAELVGRLKLAEGELEAIREEDETEVRDAWFADAEAAGRV